MRVQYKAPVEASAEPAIIAYLIGHHGAKYRLAKRIHAVRLMTRRMRGALRLWPLRQWDCRVGL